MFSRKRVVVSFILAVIAGVAAFLLVPKPLPEMSRQDLLAEAKSGFVREVVVTDGEVITGESTKRGRFRVPLRRDDKSLIDELSALGVTVKYETEPLGLI
jgi:hypothetical protein